MSLAAPIIPVMRGRWAVALTLLAGLFLLRVLGQALVAFAGVRWLPPMSEWYSGLLPYPLLLPAQALILLVMVKIGRDVWRGAGYFATPRWWLGRPLRWASAVYAIVMALRYVVTMTLVPERRWLGGTIPIVFHWVLAAYLLTLSRYQLHRAGGP